MNVALILSGGTGTRLGSEIPKQYIKVNNQRIINYCLETFATQDEIDAIQIVADTSWGDLLREEWRKQSISMEKIRGFSQPGENRQQSIINGLRDIQKYAKENSCVMIHDAARPLLSKTLISQCFQALEGHDGVMPVLPVKDTMYLTKDAGTRIDQLIERSRLVAGQAPELFRIDKYYSANVGLSDQEIEAIRGTSELAFKAGLDIALIPGDENNFKITTKQDLERFEQIIDKM